MGIFGRIDTFITWFDGVVWGLPLIILILVTGIFLTVRLGLLQVRYLGKALKFMVKNEEDGHGEVTSFGALCTALSATIGTGNIVGVATAISAGGPGALFWMILTAFLGMATKYSEGLLAVKYRTGVFRNYRHGSLPGRLPDDHPGERVEVLRSTMEDIPKRCALRRP